MLETPLGKIIIAKNGKALEYEAKKHEADIAVIKDNPIAGCYRIYIDYEENDAISCELLSNFELTKGNSGGENYSCKVFQKDCLELTIGSFDEINDSTCVCDFTENGIVFEKLTKGKTNQLVFGVSWVVDLKEDDNRTWFASDPTYC